MKKETFFRKEMAALDGYVPGLQPRGSDVIKLNTNENPYAPPQSVFQSIQSQFKESYRLYPEPSSEKARAAIAQGYGFETANVLIGNGSDELLRIVFQAVLDQNKKVILTSPTYSLFSVLAAIQGAEVLRVDVGVDSSLPEHIPEGDLFLVANPNAPSGAMFAKEKLRQICKNFSGLVLIDEAYADFAEENCLDLLRDFSNLIITRSMSKSFSLAGLRIGYLFADKKIVQVLDKVRDSYNLNCISQLAVIAVMESKDEIDENVRKIIQDRNQFSNFLQENDFSVIQTGSNFVFASPNWIKASELFEKLLNEKILVRHFTEDGLDPFVRITIGAPYQMAVVREKILKIKKERT